MFAGSCIGVIFLTMSLAFLRRVHRAYDASIVRSIRQHGRVSRAHSSTLLDPGSAEKGQIDGAKNGLSNIRSKALSLQSANASRLGQPSFVQHLTRSLLFTTEFAIAYFLMLLAMSYNGYIILCIFIGAFLGYLVFDWQLQVT